jgi:hypothetical protein
MYVFKNKLTLHVSLFPISFLITVFLYVHYAISTSCHNTIVCYHFVHMVNIVRLSFFLCMIKNYIYIERWNIVIMHWRDILGEKNIPF